MGSKNILSISIDYRPYFSQIKAPLGPAKGACCVTDPGIPLVVCAFCNGFATDATAAFQSTAQPESRDQ